MGINQFLKPKLFKHLLSTSNFTSTLFNCFVLKSLCAKTKQLKNVLVKLLPLRRLKWSEIGLATASGCIKFTLATASDQNSCTNKYIRSGHLKGVWQLPFSLATASELWQLPLWQLPLTLATASDYS